MGWSVLYILFYNDNNTKHKTYETQIITVPTTNFFHHSTSTIQKHLKR